VTPTEPSETFGDTPPHGQPVVRVSPRRAAPPADASSDPPPGDDGAAAREGAVEPPRARGGGAGRGRHRAGAGERGTAGAGRRRTRLSRRGRIVVAVLAVLALAAGAVAWYEAEAHPFGSPAKAVMISVRHGESVDAIVSALTRKGVIGSSLAFKLWSLVHGTPVVVPGLYLFHENLPFSTVHRLLDAGPNVLRLDVEPGTTVAEVSNQLSVLPGHTSGLFETEAKSGAVRSPYQAAPGGSLEGLLGSGVYTVLPGESARALLEQMVARFDAQATAAGLSPASSVDGLRAYQLVVVASIAQKEGYFRRYMGDVARVIYNRLAQGMHLDMTSTVLYSLGQDGGPVTPAQEAVTTPYNTYLHAGLTPTPICVPSVTALSAAASPPAGPWLYFELVTPKKGTMVFSATYTGQLAAEREAAANAHK
jgi:UPF0755 protein